MFSQKQIIKWFLIGFIVLIFFGIVCPYLISLPSDLGVLLGIAICTGIFLGSILVINNLFKKGTKNEKDC